MWKQLFSEAPPGALENLLSPRRKLFYAFFALAPGTTLGLYLYSVKLEMNRDNERIRLEQITEEMAEQNAREQKDAVLANAIEDLRARIQRLEVEALASNGGKVPHLPVATVERKPAGNAEPAGKNEEKSTELPEALASAAAFWNEQKKALLSSFKKDDSPENEPSTSVPAAAKHTAPSGINDRVKMRQQEQLRKDVKAFKAAKAEQSASDSP